MRFCSECDNMYYHKIDESNTNKLIYYCRYCEHSTEVEDTFVVSKNTFNVQDNNNDFIVNEFTKNDPTLPRIESILCPNPECSTNTQKTQRDIIYIRYDDNALKYLFLCSTCDFRWKIEDNKK